MLDRLLGLLQGNASSQPLTEDPRLSVAALLVEAGLMHHDFSESERAMTAQLLAQRFDLSAAEAAELVARAEARVSRSAQYFPFTHSINQSMEIGEKIEVIEMLWRIAYADGKLDAFEDQLIRQLGGLLHVPDRDRMLARKRVLGS